MHCIYIFRSSRSFFLGVVTSAEMNVSIHNIELSCFNYGERPRFDTGMCLPLVYQWQGKWKYLHWNARLLFSLPSTGIKTVFPLFLPSGSLAIFLFCKKIKDLVASLRVVSFWMSRNAPPKDKQLINVMWQSRNLILKAMFALILIEMRT